MVEKYYYHFNEYLFSELPFLDVCLLMNIYSFLKVLLNHSIQSPEVTSKTVPTDEELNETAKTLSAKLSEALVNIREKEDLVKQHAKVAEEAVSGTTLLPILCWNSFCDCL